MVTTTPFGAQFFKDRSAEALGQQATEPICSCGARSMRYDNSGSDGPGIYCSHGRFLLSW